MGTAVDRAGIAARIPHRDAMCLLDTVQAWTPTTIHCSAHSHRNAGHPLGCGGRLGIACGIEYAAQAMAVHGALVAGASAAPRRGYLASVRGVDFFTDRLDTVSTPLAIFAERLSGDDNTVLYRFSIDGDGRCLLSGRAAVILDADRQ